MPGTWAGGRRTATRAGRLLTLSGVRLLTFGGSWMVWTLDRLFLWRWRIRGRWFFQKFDLIRRKIEIHFRPFFRGGRDAGLGHQTTYTRACALLLDQTYGLHRLGKPGQASSGGEERVSPSRIWELRTPHFREICESNLVLC